MQIAPTTPDILLSPPGTKSSRVKGPSIGGPIMAVYDVNGDGFNDIDTVLQAHGYGIAWFDQKREEGKITFQEHMIQDDPDHPGSDGVIFSQAHTAKYGDMDGVDS